MMVSQVYAGVQTHQIVDIKCAHFFVCQLYLKKAVKQNLALMIYHPEDNQKKSILLMPFIKEIPPNGF